MKRALLVLLPALASCADARDLLRPYAPDDAERREVLALPWPAKIFDAAVVLGCPADPDGSPSMCQRCRVKTAVRDYRKSTAKNLIFSGGAAHSPDVEAVVMGRLAEKRGVPAEHVFREGRALTTWQNVRFVKRMLAENGFATVLFISTSDHLPRARRIALFYGIDDAHAGYQACDLDLPHDSDEEWQEPWPPRPEGTTPLLKD